MGYRIVRRLAGLLLSLFYLHRRLLARRRALVDELTALALLVPDAVRLGETKDE